ncbi:dihydroxyacetone kinase transcriptional activator DhaS [Streptococcus gallolyticus]|uniref:dihydroxyacetone kinase transcriptional activator DhaS n=1 Tax=Streptococcus hepaticus TaxID=3349163 RepID=UPI001C985C4B|nr:dihydroxyacetone kinase transcriptional activator DhaS [Streptococcus gallolyticus]MBY5040233.1 dihydroxyacetone kinase transcriptional activator DhaS [Streptococcus gallolyticus]
MVSSLITKKRIAKAFKRLFVRQSFEKISVSVIMEEAGVRRQTFYNHFVDKYELLEWIFQTELREQVTDNLDYISGIQLLTELLHFFHCNRDFYRKLFEIEDQNDFSSYFEGYCQQLIAKLIADYQIRTFETEEEKELFLTYHSLALANLIKHLLTCSTTSCQLDNQAIVQLITTSLENY